MAAGSWFGAAALLDLYPIVASGQRQHPLSCSPQRSKRGDQPKIARFGDPCQNHGSKSQSWLVPDAEGADQAWWTGARREGARKHMIGRQQHGVVDTTLISCLRPRIREREPGLNQQGSMSWRGRGWNGIVIVIVIVNLLCIGSPEDIAVNISIPDIRELQGTSVALLALPP